jgi:selenocysteine-specific elongation factor
MHVVATAGHVDHGKSALVKALSGIDPDRLKEEQARQMTIDLGFAWASLPEEQTIGIVDVPGHEDFIENMLAGVGAIDAVLFVVAADEGPMPQTVEHAEILGLLGIASGVVALTKVDLVDDRAWLELVSQEVQSLLASAGLPPMVQVPVSSLRGDGIERLRMELGHVLAGVPERADRGRPRLAVDRVFTMEGFGTVATGTLMDGALHAGDEVEIAPRGARARVRGLQTHREQVEVADPGRRLAVNLSGVDVGEVRRGDVLMLPASHLSSQRIDVLLQVLPTADGGVRHGETVKVFHGAARHVARLWLLERDRLDAGESGWGQLDLETPLTADVRDRLILRRPSPPGTIAGGRIADMKPGRRHRRRDREVLNRLERALSTAPTERLLAAAENLTIASPADLLIAAGTSGEDAERALTELMDAGRLLRVSGDQAGGSLMARSVQAHAWETIEAALSEHRGRYPLRPGMPKEELRSKAGLGPGLFAAALEVAEREGRIERRGAIVSLRGAAPELTPAQVQLVDRFMGEVAASKYSPMSVKDARAFLGAELFQYELTRGSLVQVSPDVFFDAETYDEMVGQLRAAALARGSITVAEARDLFNTSRRYVLALMEHLDELGVTVRDGDQRSFRRTPAV